MQSLLLWILVSSEMSLSLAAFLQGMPKGPSNTQVIFKSNIFTLIRGWCQLMLTELSTPYRSNDWMMVCPPRCWGKFLVLTHDKSETQAKKVSISPCHAWSTCHHSLMATCLSTPILDDFWQCFLFQLHRDCCAWQHCRFMIFGCSEGKLAASEQLVLESWGNPCPFCSAFFLAFNKQGFNF